MTVNPRRLCVPDGLLRLPQAGANSLDMTWHDPTDRGRQRYRFVPGGPRVTKGAMANRVSVIGTGYLGTAHAACLASLGFEVLGLDTDAAQVAFTKDQHSVGDLGPAVSRNHSA